MRKIWLGTLTIILTASALFATSIGPTTHSASAFPSFPSTWAAEYPASDSLSNANQCQLCHQGASGGDGWNAYGWAVRQQIYDQGQTIDNAIIAVAALDSDGNGSSNVNEITANSQPGWKVGATNTIYFKNGTTQLNQSAPASVSGVLDTGTTTIPSQIEVRLAIIHR